MSKVQSIIIKKDHYTLVQAKNWVKKHGYLSEVDEKHDTYRFRQMEPDPKYKYRTVPIAPGIEYVITVPKR